MSALNQYIPDYLFSAIGWTLLHGLWQSVVVITVMFFLRSIFKPSSSNSKYLTYVISLLSITLWAIYTFTSQLVLATNISVSNFTTYVNSISFTSVVPQLNELSSSGVFENLEIYFPYFIGFWIIGVSFFTIKTLGGLWYIQRLKVNGISAVEPFVIQKFKELKDQMGISKNVRLLQSNIINIPIVIGHIKPIILMPIGLCTGLTIDEVEAILAHELSHIRRHDFLINIIQSIIEAVFFYNPIIWWLSNQIRTERENCCDDVALHIGINKLTFAKALANIQQLKINTTMAMTLGKNNRNLMKRIQRLFEGDVQYRSNVWDKILPVMVIIGALISLSWYSIQPPDESSKTALTKINIDLPQENELVSTENISDALKSNSIRTDAMTNYQDDNKNESVAPTELIDTERSKIAIDIDSNHDDIVQNLNLDMDTIPSENEPQIIDLKEILEEQNRAMEEMSARLSEMASMKELEKTLTKEEMARVQELAKRITEETIASVRIHENDMEENKLHMEQLYQEMEKLHQLEELKELDKLHEVEEKLRDVERIMRDKEVELRQLEKKMMDFERELEKELVKDGYLKNGEKLNDIQFNDDQIKVNGQKIKDKDAKKYYELRKKYLDK